MRPNERKRFHAGNQRFFAKLFLKQELNWRRIISKFARGDPELADELFQQLCAKIFVHRLQFKAAGSLEGWCATMCRNVCLDHFRTEDRAPISVTLTEGSVDLTADSRSESQRTRHAEAQQAREDAVDNAILALPPRLRVVAIARFLSGWKAEQIEAEFDLTRQTVYTMLSQSRAILRRTLKPFARRPAHTPV
jgi:RNA polymerase sigma factor (sigma-70 family)